MRIGILQLNPTPGAIEENAGLILDAWRACADKAPDLVCTAELALSGYPPRDLLDRPDFHDRLERALAWLAARTADGPPLLVGTPIPSTLPYGRPHQNAAVLLDRGERAGTVAKTLLPTYDVFDEARYFEPAPHTAPLFVRGVPVAVLICEDMWNDKDFWPRQLYANDPLDQLLAPAPSLILNLSASPWNTGKDTQRHAIAAHVAQRRGLPLVYVNQVGANDELVFDGRSFALNARGDVLTRLPAWTPAAKIVDLRGDTAARASPPHEDDELIDALTLGVRDYFRKTGFSRAVLGLSGGIDSALTAAIAVRALGADHVVGVTMPGPYSSKGSVDDSIELARLLGIELRTLPITEIWNAFLTTLAPVLGDAPADITEQNLQARCRGTVLMAISNRENRLLLTTGNKSEIAVGYCTLYGDMCGALAVIADLSKTRVWALARRLNEHAPTIPVATIEKPPSAELAPGQLDEDSLPPYPTLDSILEQSIVENRPFDAIVASGHDPDTVRRVLRLLDLAEYKRRQAAPGLRVTTRAFGMGRRMPIAAQFSSRTALEGPSEDAR